MEYDHEYDISEPNRDSMPPVPGQENINPYMFEDRGRILPEFAGLQSMPPASHGMRMMNPYQHQMVVTLNDLSSMLDENKKMLLSATRHSNCGEIDETIKELRGIHHNLIILANAADLQPNSRFVLKEQREFVSQKNLAYFNLKFPVQETIYGQTEGEK